MKKKIDYKFMLVIIYTILRFQVKQLSLCAKIILLYISYYLVKKALFC